MHVMRHRLGMIMMMFCRLNAGLNTTVVITSSLHFTLVHHQVASMVTCQRYDRSDLIECSCKLPGAKLRNVRLMTPSDAQWLGM